MCESGNNQNKLFSSNSMQKSFSRLKRESFHEPEKIAVEFMCT